MALKIPATGTGDPTPTVATDVLGDGSHAQKVKLLDGTAGSANAATVDSSGNVHTAVQSLPGSPAQEGTDATGIAQPAGGAGLRGWLSGIYKALTGTLTVDGSGHTQPVSGTVTANAGTGTLAVDGSAHTQPVSAGSLPLPSGAATDANLTTQVGAAGNSPPALATNASGLIGWLRKIVDVLSGTLTTSVSNFPATQPVSSTDGAQATVGTTTDASSALTLVGLLKAVKAAVQGTLTVGGTVTAKQAAASAYVTETAGGVAVGTGSVTLLSANVNRQGSTFVNTGTTGVTLTLGSTAATPVASAKTGIWIAPNGGSWDGLIGSVVWTGLVQAISDSGTNTVTVVEV